MSKHQAGNSDILLTIAEIARRLSLPESTARYYCKRFAAFIPYSGEGRRRRYRPETIAVIKKILEAMRTARTADAVEEFLAGQFPRNAESVPATAIAAASAAPASTYFSQAVVSLMERQVNAMEGIAAALGALAVLREEIQDLSAKARAAEEESLFLRKEVANLKAMLKTSEKMQQEDMEQLRGWMGRIVKSKLEEQALPGG